MTEPVALTLYPTETAAKKAGQAQVRKIRTSAFLYSLQPTEGKASYLVSTGSKLRVSERSWAEAHSMTVTKLARFHPNGCYFGIQKNMTRSSSNTETSIHPEITAPAATPE